MVFLLLCAGLDVLCKLLFRRALLLKDLGTGGSIGDMVGKLAASNQADYDTEADDKGQDEAVYAVPIWCPAADCRS